MFSFSLIILPIHASDLPELDSGSSEAVVIPEENIEDIAETIILLGSEDEQDKGYSKVGNSTLKDEIVSEIKASTATEYTTTDIYNFLYSAMRGQSTGTTYSLPFIARLLNTIRDEVHGSSVFASNPVTLYEYVKELASGNSDWSYAMGPMQFTASELDWNIVPAQELETQQYTVKDLIGFIYVNSDDIVDELGQHTTSLSAIESATGSTASTLANTYNKVNGINTNVNLIEQYTHDIRDDLNKYHWVSTINGSTPVFNGYTTDFENLLTTGRSYSQIVYAWFSGIPTDYYNNYLFKVELNANNLVLSNFANIPSIDICTRYQGAITPIKNIEKYIIPTRQSVEIYFNMPIFSTTDELIIRFNYTGRSLYIANNNFTFLNISSASPDYWDILDKIKIARVDNNIDKIISVYASDDMIAQKEAQKPVETQVLDDFTGNGSESMSVGNAIDVKGVSSAVKSTLNAGGSINNALNILNANNNMWQWFTNTTKNNINGNNLRKSNSSNSDEYISIYQQNLDEYWRGLND